MHAEAKERLTYQHRVGLLMGILSEGAAEQRNPSDSLGNGNCTTNTVDKDGGFHRSDELSGIGTRLYRCQILAHMSPSARWWELQDGVMATRWLEQRVCRDQYSPLRCIRNERKQRHCRSDAVHAASSGRCFVG